MSSDVLPTFEIRTVRQVQSGLETYTAFDVFIDGKFHCATRFSDFASLHETLQDEFLLYDLPKFPPKKLNLNIGILSLKENDVETRRAELEKFFKAVFKEAKLLDHPVLKKFLYDERDKYLTAHAKDVKQQVFFVDGTSVTLNLKSCDKASKLKLMVAEREGMSEESSRYFALFQSSLSTGVETKMHSGSHPYLSCRKLQTVDDEDVNNPTPEAYRIIFKKWVFSPYNVLRIMVDSVGLKHLYNQARIDVNNFILRPDKQMRVELDRLESKQDMRGYLRVARTIPGYYAHYFGPCTSDYPQPSSRVIFSVSTDGMVLFLLNDNSSNTMNGREEIVLFSFERIRRWKYVESEMLFGWEYFFGTNSEGGRWINLKTEQYFDMNTSTQEYVDELKRRLTQAEYMYKEEDIGREEARVVSNPSAQLHSNLPSNGSAGQLFATPTYPTQDSRLAEPAQPKKADMHANYTAEPAQPKKADMHANYTAEPAQPKTAGSPVIEDGVPVTRQKSAGALNQVAFGMAGRMQKMLGRGHSTENAAFVGGIDDDDL